MELISMRIENAYSLTVLKLRKNLKIASESLGLKRQVCTMNNPG